MNSRQDKAANLAAAEEGIEKLAYQGVDLVVLPEMFNHLGSDEANAAAAEEIPGPSTEWARGQARGKGIFLHCGSVIERRDEGNFNTSVVYDRSGDEVARYSKLHLFDIVLPDGSEYLESQAINARRPDSGVRLRRRGRRPGHLLRPPVPRAVPGSCRVRRRTAPAARRLHGPDRHVSLGAADPRPGDRERLLHGRLRPVGLVGAAASSATGTAWWPIRGARSSPSAGKAWTRSRSSSTWLISARCGKGCRS